jgi:multiple antibiotic resistance protein
MFEIIIKLIILFIVIIDPALSFVFFITNTKNLNKKEKIRTALKSILFAFFISFVFLIFGSNLLKIFSVELSHFQISGGIILLILGVKMTLGLTFKNNIEENNKKDTLPTIIATPLISGPACITTIMLQSIEYGKLITGIALTSVLLITGMLLLIASIMNIKKIGTSGIKMLSTLLGLITLSWGVSFILNGLGL